MKLNFESVYAEFDRQGRITPKAVRLIDGPLLQVDHVYAVRQERGVWWYRVRIDGKNVSLYYDPTEQTWWAEDWR